MLPDTYFKKNGFIYGCRSRYNGHGDWTCEIVRFVNFKKAMEWKNKKEFGWKRELISKNEVKLRKERFHIKQEIK